VFCARAICGATFELLITWKSISRHEIYIYIYVTLFFFFFEVLSFGSCSPNDNILFFLKIILTINEDRVKLLIPSYALNPRDVTKIHTLAKKCAPNISNLMFHIILSFKSYISRTWCSTYLLYPLLFKKVIEFHPLWKHKIDNNKKKSYKYILKIKKSYVCNR